MIYYNLPFFLFCVVHKGSSVSTWGLASYEHRALWNNLGDYKAQWKGKRQKYGRHRTPTSQSVVIIDTGYSGKVPSP